MINTLQLFDKQNNPITDCLVEINDYRLICRNDGIDFLPSGGIIDCVNFFVNENLAGKSYYLVNKRDLKNVQFDNKEISGCCGPDGDTINVFDSLHNSIGFEHGDCWMSHFIKIPKAHVTMEKREVKNEIIIFAMIEYNNQYKILDRAIGLNYLETKKRLDILVEERLKMEFMSSKLQRQLAKKIIYSNINDLEFKEQANVEDLWLFTKYVRS